MKAGNCSGAIVYCNRNFVLLIIDYNSVLLNHEWCISKFSGIRKTGLFTMYFISYLFNSMYSVFQNNHSLFFSWKNRFLKLQHPIYFNTDWKFGLVSLWFSASPVLVMTRSWRSENWIVRINTRINSCRDWFLKFFQTDCCFRDTYIQMKSTNHRDI